MIGNVRPDGKNRIYFTSDNNNNTAALNEIEYAGGQWTRNTYTLSGNNNVCGSCMPTITGPGRNDGTNRLYTGQSEIYWDGTTFSGTSLWQGRPQGNPSEFDASGYGSDVAMMLGVGPAKNDGIQRVYALTARNDSIYELAYNDAGYYEPKKLFTTAVYHPYSGLPGSVPKFLITNGRNDGLQRIYQGWGMPTASGGNERELVELFNATGSVTSAIPASAGYTVSMVVDVSSSAEGMAAIADQTFSPQAVLLTLASTTTFVSTGSLTGTGIGFVLTSTITALAPSKEITYSVFYTTTLASTYNPMRFKIARYDDASTSWVLPAYNIADVNTTSMTVSGNFAALGKFQLMVATTSAVTKLIPTSGGTISIIGDFNNWTGSVTIPNAAFTNPMVMTVTPLTSFPSSVSGYLNNGRTETVIPTGIGFSVEKSTPGISPSADLTLSITYDSAFMASYNLRKLYLMRYNSSNAQWESCEAPAGGNCGGYGINLANNTITYSGRTTSTFQIMQAESENNTGSGGGGTPSDTYGYPSPFSIGKHGTMRFINAKAGETIKIFSLGGYFIKEIAVNANGIGLWDGKDEGGQKVSPGTYLVVAGNEKFKIMVLP
ncbi:MAG: hypothetical protein HY747_00730 [Elusimicrobia bacterium]|nr:hypothetical protein [Elusimicrobiota bacterium]